MSTTACCIAPACINAQKHTHSPNYNRGRFCPAHCMHLACRTPSLVKSYASTIICCTHIQPVPIVSTNALMSYSKPSAQPVYGLPGRSLAMARCASPRGRPTSCMACSRRTSRPCSARSSRPWAPHWGRAGTSTAMSWPLQPLTGTGQSISMRARSHRRLQTCWHPSRAHTTTSGLMARSLCP